MNILQIGCNNCDDHVFDFIQEHRRDIHFFGVVDALPKCCAKAKEVYKNVRGFHVYNNAIGTKNERCRFYFPAGEDQSAHASMSSQHVIRHNHPELDSVEVNCIDINDFLKGIPHLDRLYIDIEGFDVPVLLHLEDFNIPYIEYEFSHGQSTFNPGFAHNLLLQKFQEHGYSVQQISEYNCAATKNQ